MRRWIPACLALAALAGCGSRYPVQGQDAAGDRDASGLQDGGTVACDAACHFDWSGCTVPLCGDGIVEGFEMCDGADLGGHACTDWGFFGGTLACGPTCVVFDLAGCTGTPTPP